MITSGPVQIFFKQPDEPVAAAGDCVLYHLRSDLEALYGKEDEYVAVRPQHVLLAMMGMLAGIDYLSWVYSSGGSRQRFIEMLKDLAGLSVDDSEALYQLRCALVHEVSLAAVSRSYRNGNLFSFVIDDTTGTPLIMKVSDTRSAVDYKIGFWELKRNFKAVIDRLLEICNEPNNKKNGHVINMVGQLHSEKILRK